MQLRRESNYLRIQYLTDEWEYGLRTPIHHPVSFMLGTKSFEDADVEKRLVQPLEVPFYDILSA